MCCTEHVLVLTATPNTCGQICSKYLALPLQEVKCLQLCVHYAVCTCIHCAVCQCIICPQMLLCKTSPSAPCYFQHLILHLPGLQCFLVLLCLPPCVAAGCDSQEHMRHEVLGADIQYLPDFCSHQVAQNKSAWPAQACFTCP